MLMFIDSITLSSVIFFVANICCQTQAGNCYERVTMVTLSTNCSSTICIDECNVDVSCNDVHVVVMVCLLEGLLQYCEISHVFMRFFFIVHDVCLFLWALSSWNLVYFVLYNPETIAYKTILKLMFFLQFMILYISLGTQQLEFVLYNPETITY